MSMLVGKGSVRRSLVTLGVKATEDPTAEVFAGKKIEKHVNSQQRVFLYFDPNVVIQEDQSRVMSTN